MTGLVKVADILGVGAGPAALDIINAQFIQQARDMQLVGQGKGDALALAAIAQGGVVDGDFGSHDRAPLRPPQAVVITRWGCSAS